MLPTWSRFISCAILIGVGFLFGTLYSQRTHDKPIAEQIGQDVFVRSNECPATRMARIYRFLEDEDLNLTAAARQELHAEHQDLMTRICRKG